MFAKCGRVSKAEGDIERSTLLRSGAGKDERIMQMNIIKLASKLHSQLPAPPSSEYERNCKCGA